jgi:hypothetical protein
VRLTDGKKVVEDESEPEDVEVGAGVGLDPGVGVGAGVEDETIIASVSVKVSLEPPPQLLPPRAVKLMLYVPSELGAVTEKLTLWVPFVPKFSWSTQLSLLMFQFVALQLLPPVRVTFTAAVMEAEGATVTLLAPFNVTELIVCAA